MFRNATKSIGVKYNHLTVQSLLKKGKVTFCVAVCDCGNINEHNLDNIKRGQAKSCGCLLTSRITTHKLSNTKSYRAWDGMKRRCKPDYERKAYYYDKGVSVCDEWINDFERFYEDMGSPPSTLHTLDRIDGMLGYSKSNCRWATRREQSQNVKSNRNILYNGETKCLAEWARQYVIPPNTLHHRLAKGWSISDAFNRPINVNQRRH